MTILWNSNSSAHKHLGVTASQSAMPVSLCLLSIPLTPPCGGETDGFCTGTSSGTTLGSTAWEHPALASSGCVPGHGVRTQQSKEWRAHGAGKPWGSHSGYPGPWSPHPSPGEAPSSDSCWALCMPLATKGPSVVLWMGREGERAVGMGPLCMSCHVWVQNSEQSGKSSGFEVGRQNLA